MTLEQPSALEMRAELEALALRDLLGPAGGPKEIVVASSVRLWCVMGPYAHSGTTPNLPCVSDTLRSQGRYRRESLG